MHVLAWLMLAVRLSCLLARVEAFGYLTLLTVCALLVILSSSIRVIIEFNSANSA